MAANLVFTNAKIATVNAGDEFVTAVAISGERFLAVGGDAEVRQHVDRQTRVVDLGGRTVIPGIIDSHNHIVQGGTLLEGVMLFDARDLDELRELVAMRVAESLPGEWVEGGGWIESQFAEYRMPTRHDLDPVSGANPVILDRLFGASVVNSKALELAGIDRNTPDPVQGTIDRDPQTGEPTGILRNGAQALVKAILAARPAAGRLERLRHLIDLACREYLRWGITSIIDPGVPPVLMQAYQQMRDADRLPLRLNAMPVWHGLYAALMEQANLDGKPQALGTRTGFGDDWLRLGALKMAIDGGLGSRTALTNQPFKDGSTSQVPLRLDVTKLDEYFRLGMHHDWSIGIHCCGDKAQDLACEAFARALEATGRRPARHNIIHGYLPTPRSLELMAKYDIGVSVQPGFMWVEGDIYFDVVEQERLDHFKPLVTYLKHGIRVAANSDMASAHYNPFLGMYAAVARRTSQGRSLGDAERLRDRNQMIRLFTANGAWLSGEEERKGTIEPGKLADLAVLSGDLFSLPDEAIRELRVDLTVVGGKIVHHRAV